VRPVAAFSPHTRRHAMPIKRGSVAAPLFCRILCLLVELEPDLQDKLHLTSTHAGAGDPADVARADQIIRQGKRWMVGDVGSIGAKVQLHTLRNIKYLVKRHVDGAQFRTDYGVSPIRSQPSQRPSSTDSTSAPSRYPSASHLTHPRRRPN